ncbi:MAG: hypothetical protein K2N71_00680 [Oscillospiraceae bacterium]|nr:hypothetical protein [Oscillospiraceae bacterium]
MASAKIEYELEVNRGRMNNIRKSLKFGFLASVIASGVMFLAMGGYYFIRALAGMAGSTMIWGEYYVRQAMDGEAASPVTENFMYEYPYGFMAYLLITTGLAIASYVLKKRGYNTALLVFYAIGVISGLYGLIFGSCGAAMGIFLLVSGGLGVWLEIFLLGVYKELDYLSLQDGYPDFIPLLTEPQSMSNTTGLTYKQSEYKKNVLKEQKKKNEYVSAGFAEMEELTLDTELPKGNRKIDNMM